ncbi:MAG: TonB-dependent receptor domain-containing protein [Terriglobales bacterium]
MTRLMKLWLVFLAIALISGSAVAQSAATAELHVLAKDPNGLVVKNATVTVRNEARNVERAATANPDGEYQFLSVPPGRYTITVQAPGFAKMVARDVTITIGQKAEVPVTLQIAAVESVINVSTEAEMVETQRSAQTTTIDQIRIEDLPINGRNYINFALTDSKLARDTAPSIGAAPTSGLNVGGQRARSNLVNVDGADAVDNSTNGIRSTVSQEAVQEFQIITDGFNAEYGRASGGVVNIITRAGTNGFHGSAFGFLRNRNIQGVNHFSTLKDPAYTRYQAGAAAGGPIKKDRTFYFLSYETTRRNESGYSSIGANNFDLVPFNTAPLAPMLGGNNFGTVLLTADQAAFVGKLAGQIAALPPAVQAAYLGAGPARLLAGYLVAAGGGAAIGVNGVLPSLTMAGAVAQNIATSPVYPGQTPCIAGIQGGVPIPCANVFPSSGYRLPANWVPLKDLIGDFPVHEGTTLISARLDHHINASQSLMLRAGVSPSTVTGIQVQAQGPQSLGLNAWSRTSQQTYRDFNIMGQHEWTLGNTKVNEFRFQFSRRGLLYNYSSATDAAGRPVGSFVGNQVAGYAFMGREPFSFVNRTEQRYQVMDNFSVIKGHHTFKWGGDFNYLPVKADFTVNFGGVMNIGSLSAAALFKDPTGAPLTAFPAVPGNAAMPLPQFSPVQAYGLGIPSYMVQGVGNPHDEFSNKVLGAYIQDTWRMKPSLTLNYGLRYDVEFTPTFKAINALSQAAQDAMGITQGIPRDYNNIAPRIGVAWDPWNNGKTVVRANYGMFYDHPLLALAFDSDVADMAQAPQLLFFGAAPGFPAGPTGIIRCLSATNVFQGIASQCLPASFNYLGNEQRFNPAPNAPSIFTDQQFIAAGLPISVLPFGFPVGKNFVYAYSQQANLAIERDLGHNFAVSLEYNFNGGRHLNRPIDVNTVRSDLIIQNWKNAMADPAIPAATRGGFASDPRLVDVCGVGPAGPYIPAAVANFFRPSGVNSSLVPFTPAPCMGVVNQVLAANKLGVGVPVPFSSLPANLANGSSVYHGMTATLRKRMSNHYEFLASYTWSHAIDDSTDLQSPLSPADSNNLAAERSNSTFDQRHRLVFSAVLHTGKMGGNGFAGKLLSDWTFAPILDIASGRPFNLQSSGDTNFDFGASDRPSAVAGPGTNSCGDTAVQSKFSPTGWLQPACFLDGTYDGNLGRNAGVRPWVVFGDIRLARRINLTERLKLDGIIDVFNVANKYNVADVNTFWANAGRPVAAFDPRQFQFALKLTW